ERLRPAASNWRIQGRALRGIFARTLGGPVHFLSRDLVGDHRHLVPLGASVFRRWWQNVGNQLDFGLCAQRLAGEAPLVEYRLVRVLPPLGRTRSPLRQSGSSPALPMIFGSDWETLLISWAAVRKPSRAA